MYSYTFIFFYGRHDSVCVYDDDDDPRGPRKSRTRWKQDTRAARALLDDDSLLSIFIYFFHEALVLCQLF